MHSQTWVQATSLRERRKVAAPRPEVEVIPHHHHTGDHAPSAGTLGATPIANPEHCAPTPMSLSYNGESVYFMPIVCKGLSQSTMTQKSKVPSPI